MRAGEERENSQLKRKIESLQELLKGKDEEKVWFSTLIF